MTTIGADFYDNSSNFLGLSYSASTENPLLSDSTWNDRFNENERRRLEALGEPLPPRVLADGSLEDQDIRAQERTELDRVEKERPDLNFPDQLRLAKERVSARQRQTPKNAGAYDDDRRELALVSRESPGLPLVERQRIARERALRKQENPEDAPKTTIEKERDRLGASIPSLMARPNTGDRKGGGRSGRKHSAKKKGTWVCPNCHLEYCIHRPVQTKAGKSKGGVHRPHIRKARVSDYIATLLFEQGLSATDALEVFGKAFETGFLDTLIKDWKATIAK